ncbi:M23 family metallopeptidase [Spirillospora sp. CA-294931]|uniref:M23 family metallopeptidase n=1 Tax=Spirillospora sp. CA-294931 TaxID=3240042 RepID=UPI003D9344C5
MVRPFSPPSQPWGAGHRGIDLAANPGQPVYAAGPGRVSYAARLAGRGVVAITHGALRTTYLPVHPTVRPGLDVKTGARIGTVEASAPHCLQPCLHWGLRQGATYLDPLALVRPRVRLLPHWTPAPAPARSSEVSLRRDATTAGGGALTGVLLTFGALFVWRHTRPRKPRRPPPGVVDLARERHLRRNP